MSPGTQKLIKDLRLYLVKITSLLSKKAFWPQNSASKRASGAQVPIGVLRPRDGEQGAWEGVSSCARLLPRNME